MTVNYLHPELRKSQADVRLGVTSHEALKQQRMQQQLRVLELTEMLHRKRDLMLLIECFFIETQAFVKYDGLNYQQPDHVPASFLGSRRQHVVRFELSIGAQALGEITFYRSTPFSPREDRELERLIAHICYPLENALDYQAKIQATLVDELTGLNNRLAFDQSLPREIVLARRNETPMSLLLLDVDRFQQISDTHGEDVGNDILSTVASTLANSIRKSDMIFRYDRDTFAIVLLGTEFHGAKVLAERLRTAIDVCFRYENVQVVLSASAGITELVEKDSIENLLGRSMEAVLDAKNAGRNTLRALDAPESSLALV